MTSDTGTYCSLGGSNFESFVPIKQLLGAFCLHQVNFKVTVCILTMTSDTGTYWSLGGSNFESFVPIKKLLVTIISVISLHQVNFEVTVCILVFVVTWWWQIY